MPTAAIALALGALVLLTIGALAAMWRAEARAYRRVKRIRREGRGATVEVRAVTRTSRRVNKEPVVKLKLEVREDGYPTRVTTSFFVIETSVACSLRPGLTFDAKLDPEDPDTIFVEAWQVPGAPVEP